VCVCVRELRGKIVEVYVVLKPGFSPSNEIEHKVSDAIEKEIGKIASEEREPGRAGCERALGERRAVVHREQHDAGAGRLLAQISDCLDARLGEQPSVKSGAACRLRSASLGAVDGVSLRLFVLGSEALAGLSQDPPTGAVRFSVPPARARPGRPRNPAAPTTRRRRPDLCQHVLTKLASPLPVRSSTGKGVEARKGLVELFE
jgi:hypothetical protein